MKCLISEERTWFYPTEDIRALDGKRLRIIDPSGATTMARLGLKDAGPTSSHAGMVSVVMIRAMAEPAEVCGLIGAPIRIQLQSEYLIPAAVDLLSEHHRQACPTEFVIEIFE
jgi:hypothetical protein